jgi:hypothetical protein
MIIVTPNAFTLFEGSMYSNSVTTGNWEDYIAKGPFAENSSRMTFAQPTLQMTAAKSSGRSVIARLIIIPPALVPVPATSVGIFVGNTKISVAAVNRFCGAIALLRLCKRKQ